jgi:putative ABC transport system permease protein
MLTDVARSLRRQPGPAAVVVLTLALAIGATTVLFSVVSGVLLKPLPWAHADRLVRLSETREGATRSWPRIFSNGTYYSWLDHPTTIDAIAGFGRDTMTLSGDGDAERILVAKVTASLFSILEARPELGTVFSPEEEAEGGVVVLSHGLWQRRFGGDAAVLGKIVRLDDQPHRVVGVMSREFAFPDREARAWVPMHIPPLLGADGKSQGIWIFSAIARLRPGATPQQAGLEATARARQAPDPGMVVLALFGSRGPQTVTAEPVLAAMTSDVRPALLLLLAAAVLLLLTATANVAGILLARATARRHELAVRAALGAGRARLARLLLGEGVLLGLMGGLGGLALATVGHAVLPTLLPADFPRLANVAFDGRVAAFALAAAVLTGLACGLPPALFAGRMALASALADDGRSAIGPGRSRTARAFILSGQVAVSAVLLLGAVQLGRSLYALLDADRGYEPANLLTARLPLPSTSYTPERRAALVGTLLERLRGLPGVRVAAVANVQPLGDSESMIAFEMHPRGGSGEKVQANAGMRIVSAGYFEALGLRLAEGRALSEADTAGAPPAIVVNRTFARRYLGTPAVGGTVTLPEGDGDATRDWTVVGVVEDVRQGAMVDPPQPEVYVSYPQHGPGFRPSRPILLVRTAGSPQLLAPLLRALVREQDPQIALDSVMTMENQLSVGLAQPRLYATLLTIFALSALAITGVGLFGVLAYGVALRTREFGVRQALGARPVDIVRLVAGQGLRLAGAGLAVGLVAALALSRLTASLLYGVSPHDPLSLVAVAACVGLVALLACAVPALRAVRVDPQQLLRAE